MRQQEIDLNLCVGLLCIAIVKYFTSLKCD